MTTPNTLTIASKTGKPAVSDAEETDPGYGTNPSDSNALIKFNLMDKVPDTLSLLKETFPQPPAAPSESPQNARAQPAPSQHATVQSEPENSRAERGLTDHQQPYTKAQTNTETNDNPALLAYEDRLRFTQSLADTDPNDYLTFLDLTVDETPAHFKQTYKHYRARLHSDKFHTAEDKKVADKAFQSRYFLLIQIHS
jgi:hypothetical protein